MAINKTEHKPKKNLLLILEIDEFHIRTRLNKVVHFFTHVHFSIYNILSAFNLRISGNKKKVTSQMYIFKRGPFILITNIFCNYHPFFLVFFRPPSQ